MTRLLSETFTAILCLSNDSDFVAIDPTLSVEMHTSDGQPNSSGFKDILSTWSLPSLAPKESKETMVDYEIKELCLHAIVCRVDYMAHNDAYDGMDEREAEMIPRSFRKVFKFNVGFDALL